jgi:hypothetical protein
MPKLLSLLELEQNLLQNVEYRKFNTKSKLDLKNEYQSEGVATSKL